MACKTFQKYIDIFIFYASKYSDHYYNRAATTLNLCTLLSKDF